MNIKYWRHALWTFIKAQVSAQVATITDFAVTILLTNVVGIFYFYAIFSGALLGGIVNCIINYGWVFHSDECKKTHVAVKYFIVWGCSILFNTWGTFFLTEWLRKMSWMNNLFSSYIYILPKIFIAVLIAIFWNYQMQRLFVYRNHNIRKFFRIRSKE